MGHGSSASLSGDKPRGIRRNLVDESSSIVIVARYVILIN